MGDRQRLAREDQAAMRQEFVVGEQAGSLDDDTLKLLKMRWRGLGNRLRVVAPPGSGAADAERSMSLSSSPRSSQMPRHLGQ